MKYFLIACIAIASMAFMPGHPSSSLAPTSDTLVSRHEFNIPVPFFSADSVTAFSRPFHGVLGYSSEGRPIEAWYFPGKMKARALVIGGVHGSELSSIEVAKNVIRQLEENRNNDYSVIVIPCLFPDNAVTAMEADHLIGTANNVGRYSHAAAPDPNRQMPSPGKAFDVKKPFDYLGRFIEKENQLLLTVIQQFQPERIANIHAIRDPLKAGIYADPRTDSDGHAYEYASDSALAINMAIHIQLNGGIVRGNNLAQRPTALYYCDPPVSAEGAYQVRNLHGSRLPGGRGAGVSLGTWASTAVQYPARAASRLFTIEFPGYRRASDYADILTRQKMTVMTSSYASAVTKIFLRSN